MVDKVDKVKRESLPKLFEQCRDTYEFMAKHVSGEKYDGKDVYIGFLTKDLEEALGIPLSQYSRIINTLKELNCIGQIKRGAARVPSEWVLIGPPDYEAFGYTKELVNKRLQRSTRFEVQKMNEIIDILNGLIDRVEILEGKNDGETEWSEQSWD